MNLTLLSDIKHTSCLPRLLSVLLHVTIITLALISGPISPRQLPGGLINLALYAPNRLILPEDAMAGGGGGGGRHALTRASVGKLPRAADKQLLPPNPEPSKSVDPALIVEPSIVAPQLAYLPQLKLLTIGDPDGVPGPPSPGRGTGHGIGDGNGHGVGDSDGPGAGPGENGGCCGGPFRIGGGITAPILIAEVLPEYSEEARKARFQGTVVLTTIVREDGSVQVIKVVRGIGFGLDQNAIAAVLQWRFKPARRDGKPVASYLNVEVSFNLR
jgi:protein TonB